jgi:hypothetical protein
MARVGLAAACASAGLLVFAGCGGRDAGPSGIPPGLAERLAAASDDVAEQLESGNPCEALRLTGGLERAGRAAARSGQLPAPFAGELLTSIEDLRRSIECAPPPPPSPAQAQTTTIDAETAADGRNDKPEKDHGDRGQPKDDKHGNGGGKKDD